MILAENEQLIQTSLPRCPYLSFGERIHFGAPVGSEHTLDPYRSEYSGEGRGELGIPVMDQEAQQQLSVSISISAILYVVEGLSEIACLLCHPG